MFLKCFGRKRDQVESSSMDPSMYKAAISGDGGFLQAIRDGKASTDLLSQKTPTGNNILHLAAEFKQVSFFKDVPSFVEGFPLVWAINKMGDSPLHIAARVGCVELVEFLIDRAKILHVQRAGDQERGSTYYETYKKLLRKTNLKKHTALHVAVQYGHHDAVIPLMKADPELCCSTDTATESPLFLATCKGFSKIAAEILKEPSVSPSFQGVNGVTALHAAASHTYQGAEDIVNSMVSKCPDMMKKADALGWTPLHYAAFRGNLKAITLLMEPDKSSTPYILDIHGMTALHVAAYKGHVEVMKELMQYQPDTCECLNAKDQTILHVAVLGAQRDVVKYILKQPELSRLVNQADEEGYTPLQLAVMGQNHEITRMLTPDDCGVEKGFSLVFDNFLGEDMIKMQERKENNEVKEQERKENNEVKEQERKENNEVKEQEVSSESSPDSPERRFFGVPSFQEQIRRDFKKFESHSKDKNSGTSAAADNKSDVNLIITTLIATVTFTASLAPPGGYGNDGKTLLYDNSDFRMWQMFNLMSFLFSFWVITYKSIAAYLGPRITEMVILMEPSLIMASLFGMFLALFTGSVAIQNNKAKRIADPWVFIRGTVLSFIMIGPAVYIAVVVGSKYRNARPR